MSFFTAHSTTGSFASRKASRALLALALLVVACAILILGSFATPAYAADSASSDSANTSSLSPDSNDSGIVSMTPATTPAANTVALANDLQEPAKLTAAKKSRFERFNERANE